MNWVGGTLDSRVKCPWGQDTVPTVSCPRGQDKPGGTFQGKLTQGLETTRYLVPGDKIPGGQDKPVHLNRDRAQPRGQFGRKPFPVLS